MFERPDQKKGAALHRLERGRAMKEERAARARRGGDSPPVAAGLAGRPDPADVQRWTTHLPTKPPGRA